MYLPYWWPVHLYALMLESVLYHFCWKLSASFVFRELGSISYRNKKDISTQTGFPRLPGTIAQK